MKLSEAMRLGSMLTAPVKGPYVEFKDGRVCGACALGAAAVAMGYADKCDIEPYLDDLWPGLLRMDIPTCPEPSCHGGRSHDRHLTLINRVIQLFEHHDWSRERVADWIATVELQQASAAVEVGATVDAVVAPLPLTTTA